MCKEMDQIYQEGAVQGRKEGRAEGRAEGEARLVGVIRKKVSKNMSAADIADWLETGREEVERTIELLGAHPDWTDLQVAEELLGRGNLAKFDA